MTIFAHIYISLCKTVHKNHWQHFRLNGNHTASVWEVSVCVRVVISLSFVFQIHLIYANFISLDMKPLTLYMKCGMYVLYVVHVSLKIWFEKNDFCYCQKKLATHTQTHMVCTRLKRQMERDRERERQQESNKWQNLFSSRGVWGTYMANGQAVNMIELNDKIYISSLALSLS